MHELRSCDFCGADAAGAFEIVPPELEPTEAEQRRVVLCADCKDRLETLLEPLLARAGLEETAADKCDASDDDSASTGSVVATTGDSTRQRDRTPRSRPNATVSKSDADPETDADPEAASETAHEADASDASLLEDGITFEHGDEADDAEVDATAIDELVAEAESDATDADENDERTASDGESAAENNEGTASDDDSTDAPTSPPAVYSKVVRLLRNREFPMQRRAVEELAAGAYDLESHEAEAIVDYALEDGEFVEEREMLVRP
ncbi:hypothetical protein [Natrinema sp. 74]|uniref:hypothetical protein n=1 Tax=Natrinema sp. 74 TaxID=3384159 RepID=UPI0038D3A0F0